MNKDKIIKIIVTFGLPVLLVIGALFKIKFYFYYVIIFMLFGFLIRRKYKYGLLISLSFWVLSIILIRNTDSAYFSLIMLLIGNLISHLLENDTKKKKDNLDKYKKLSFLFPLVLFILIEVLFYLFNTKFYFSINVLSTVLSLFIIYILYGILYSITNRTFVSNTIMLFVMIIFFFINQFKIYFTGEAISATDLIMITEAGELVEIIKSELLNSIMYYRKLIVMLIIMIVLCINYLKKFNYKGNDTKLRLSLLFGIVIYILLLIPFEKRDVLITKTIFRDKNVTKATSINDHYGAYRMIGGLYVDYLGTIDYSETLENDKDLEKIYNSVKYEEPEKVFKKPNIILMLTEAFWDITKQDSIKFTNDPLKEYHEIRDKSIVIDTLSPVFGGKSSNTEFELITGGSLSYFRPGTIAYFKYFQTNTSLNNPAIVRELKNNGYKTYVGIAETAKTYSVDKVYTRMDFDVKNEWYEKLGYQVHDDYLIGDVIKTLKNKDKDERIFYMTVSMDSHMPFMNKYFREYDFEIKNNFLNDSMSKMAYNYTQSIRNASLQLKRLYDYIQTIEEDTIIIFLGDHLPILSSFNDDLYNYMDEFNTNDYLTNRYRKFNTETLIVSNYKIDYKDVTSMSPDLIFTTIINQMDIEISDYYKWLYTTRLELPSTNWYVAKDKKGNVYDINNLTADLQKVYNTKRKVQKYLFK